MKNLVLILILVQSVNALAQSDSLVQVNELKKFQEELTAEYKEASTSPLRGAALRKFKSHDFYPIDLNFRVKARLVLSPEAKFFSMPTSSNRLDLNRIFGYAEFTLAGKSFRIPVYQSKNLMTTKDYANYLFFPFTDNTNGVETYEGGRYIGLSIPEGDELIIDFNKAYNPYCAYSDLYSCPVVPKENYLDIDIKAGVKLKKQKK